MTRPRRMAFRPSLAETKRATLAAMEAMSHNGMSEAGRANLEELRMSVRPKVTRGKRMARTETQGKSEGEVQKEIIEFLYHHPSVHMLIRHNSGTAGDSYVEFNHIYLPKKYHAPWPKVTPKMALPDLAGLLVDSKPFAIEVKESLWSRSHGTSEKAVREQRQENYLAHVRECGGIGMFATCVENVEIELINGGYYDAHP